MEWPIIVTMIVAAPLVLLPVALVWYLNIAGVASAYKEHKTETTEEAKPVEAKVKVKAGG
jgi:hypothetical protein